MPDKAWKRGERRGSEYFGGKRTWKERQDGEAGAFSIENKYRKEIAKFLKRAVAQAERNAPPNKIPIVMLMEKGKHTKNALIIMRAETFREWFGNGDTDDSLSGA